MVKMKKYSCLLIVLLLVSCMANPIGYDRRLYGDTDLFGLNLESVLEAYTSNYGQFPDSPDDMVIFIDRITDSDYSFYQDQRDYFLRNKNKLIFVKDSLLNIYFGKQDAKHCVIKIRAHKPCENMRTAETTFFDASGNYLKCDSLAAIVTSRISYEYKEYIRLREKMGQKEFEHERTILEYTFANLRNLCDETQIDIERSEYFKNMFKYLDSLSRAKCFSRILVPCWIPR